MLVAAGSGKFHDHETADESGQGGRGSLHQRSVRALLAVLHTPQVARKSGLAMRLAQGPRMEKGRSWGTTKQIM
jgi:hypothetical protein